MSTHADQHPIEGWDNAAAPSGTQPAHEMAGSADGDVADYSAERPVNLREQRLRAPSEDRAPGLRLRATPTAGLPDSATAATRDRYGVGSANLSEPALTAAELESLREEQLRRVLGRPAGVETDPAVWGWRGKANALGAKFTPTSAEIQHRLTIERIRQPLPGTPLVVVVNPKGGGGVTPATLMLSNIFGSHRGHGVVAWDNAETRGTLAARAASAPKSVATTWDLLAHAGELCSATVVASAVSRFLLPQPTSDEILASDQSSKRQEMIGAEECAAILAVLRRHRTMVLVDTGNNDRGEAFVWSIEHATQLVIPLTYRRDAAHQVLRTLDGIAARGYSELVRAAVVVLAEGTAADPAARDAVHEALARAQIDRIVHVPFDSDLAGGDRVVFSRLADATVRAWTQVAAVVADGIAEELAHAEPELRSEYVPQSRSTPDEFDARLPPRMAQRRPGAVMDTRGISGPVPYRRAGEAAG
ncbi:MinD/ParA family protein [Nocardia sp. NPDC050630]|uniref:MinD/ParA family protein n=1 Tax=Nocardia sp. NPDC050630 TaxID=3364321 RepID=UPI0037B68897